MGVGGRREQCVSGREEGQGCSTWGCAICTPAKLCPFPPYLSSVLLTLTSMFVMSIISMYNVAPLVWYGLSSTQEGLMLACTMLCVTLYLFHFLAFSLCSHFGDAPSLACIHTHMHTHTHTHAHTRTHTHTHTRMHTQHIHTHTHTYMHTHIHTTLTYAHTHAHTHTHNTHMHTHTYMHTHAHTNTTHTCPHTHHTLAHHRRSVLNYPIALVAHFIILCCGGLALLQLRAFRDYDPSMTVVSPPLLLTEQHTRICVNVRQCVLCARIYYWYSFIHVPLNCSSL